MIILFPMPRYLIDAEAFGWERFRPYLVHDHHSGDRLLRGGRLSSRDRKQQNSPLTNSTAQVVTLVNCPQESHDSSVAAPFRAHRTVNYVNGNF
jgi:hypothetical protein